MKTLIVVAIVITMTTCVSCTGDVPRLGVVARVPTAFALSLIHI